MRTKRQPAGTPAVPAVPALPAGTTVNIIAGAFLGTWGIVAREHLPGFYWVHLEGINSRTHRRLITRQQLEEQTPKP